METITQQDRITLNNLKVADFASEETLCFTATVMFDGRPIAEARNDGHGGSTFVRALQGQAALQGGLQQVVTLKPEAALLAVGVAALRQSAQGLERRVGGRADALDLRIAGRRVHRAAFSQSRKGAKLRRC